MTEILLFGCFHFAQSGLDLFGPKAQEELAALAGRLARFAPDAIALEAAAHEQAVIDRAYARFRPERLREGAGLAGESLGAIRMFGQEHPMTYDNEVIQLGFRLGKELGLPGVFAVDEDMEMDGSPFEEPSPAMKEAMEAFSAYTGSWKDSSLTGQLKLVNQPEWARLNQAVYTRANEVGDGYAGAAAVAQWYERNLKIFSNLQRLAKDFRRIFVLYGAGHLYLLRQLIQEDGRLRLVSGEDYME